MVNQNDVDRLQEELQDLRGAVVRNERQMNERVDTVLNKARRLHDESIGTNFEPALRSVENLLGCLKRGLSAQQSLNGSLRQAS